MAGLAAVSVDLDEIRCYADIHGLPQPEGPAARAVWSCALPRLLALFEAEDVRATFFVVGRDLEEPSNRTALRLILEGHHEVANHTYAHRYDLTRLGADEMARDVRRAQDAIAEATGTPPAGFRAPGYVVTDRLLEVLADAGLRYDASVFPCPAYYAAKAAVMGAMRLAGRQSRSVLDDPRALLSPADPYRMGRPHWRRGDGLIELPIGVTPRARLPYIGTSLVMAGERGATMLTRLMHSRPLVSLELHGIDLADAHEDGLEFLAPHQPDLRRSAVRKHAILRAVIASLRAAGREFVTLAEAADRFT